MRLPVPLLWLTDPFSLAVLLLLLLFSIKGRPVLGGASDGIDDCRRNCQACQWTCNTTWACKPNEFRSQTSAAIKKLGNKKAATGANPLAAVIANAAGDALKKFTGAMGRGVIPHLSFIFIRIYYPASASALRLLIAFSRSSLTSPNRDYDPGPSPYNPPRGPQPSVVRSPEAEI
jgi:hypothetical protein